MPIIVTITKSPELANITESSKAFNEQGGSLGRGKNNDWMLNDPDRYLSSCHCQISCENGQFYITDLSTNGTFFNGSANPMGKGSKLPLSHGDTFVLGDYAFSVSLDSASQNAFSDPFASNVATPDFATMDDIFTPVEPNDIDLNNANLFSEVPVASADQLFNANPRATDPIAMLNKVRGAPINNSAPSADPFQAINAADPFNVPSQSDRVDPMNQQVNWPDSVVEQGGGGIPDDWDDDLYSSVQPVVRPQPVNAQPINPQPVNPQPINPQPVNSRSAVTSQPQLQQQSSPRQSYQLSANPSNMSLIEAMGLHNKNLNEAEMAQINTVVGEVVREMVGGLMQVLNSRSAIKNEFRMNVTTIQPIENNPIKFSANVDDALENMFVKKGNAYKKPVEAVRESFQGVAEHQVAILAGIRAAFRGIIDRFDPVQLEKRFAKQKKGGSILGNQKAKNWDLYLDYYQRLAGDADSSFQYLFGDEFVQAYEEQLQQLLIARKTIKTNTEK